MNSIVPVFRLAILAFVIAVPALVAIAVAPAGPTASSDQGSTTRAISLASTTPGFPRRSPSRHATARAWPPACTTSREHRDPRDPRIVGQWPLLPSAGAVPEHEGDGDGLHARSEGAWQVRRSPGDVDYIGQLEDDVADVIAAIRARRPAARIVLLGHSAGGGLLVRYAGGGRGPAPTATCFLRPTSGRTRRRPSRTQGDGRARISRRSPRWWRRRRGATPRDRTRSSCASTSRHPPPRRARCLPIASGWSRHSRLARISAASCRRFAGHCSC
jgi:hypothetical protein